MNSAPAAPAISVVVPVRDVAPFLPKTLDALLAQTFRPIEIILSDDGSTDGSSEICRRYAQAHPDTIRVVAGPNAGVSVARNRALDAARGEWLGFCDADDIPHPGLYARLHEMALRERADLAMCAFRWVNPSGRADGPGLSFPGQGDIVLDGPRQIGKAYFHPLLRLDWDVRAPLWACLFRRDIVENPPLRFVPRVVRCEDAVFMLEYMLRIRRIAATGEILYDYVQHRNNSSSRYKRGAEWSRAANEYRLSRERLRLFEAWPGRFRHPLERLKFRLRVLKNACRCRALRRRPPP